MSVREFVKRLVWPGPDYGTRMRYALRRRFLRDPEVTTLDVGCGNGCMTLAAAQMGKSALGISNQNEFLLRAERFRDAMGMDVQRCQFKDVNVYDMDKPEHGVGTFDQIILFEVLEHLYHDEFAVSLCAKHLTPHGWLHITVPNRDSHWYFSGVHRVENGQHVRHGYTFDSLEELLRRHGLEPIDRLQVGGLGTIWGFEAVVLAGKLAGDGGRVAAFFLTWPFVKLLDLLPYKPLSLYVLAAKRTQRAPLQLEAPTV